MRIGTTSRGRLGRWIERGNAARAYGGGQSSPSPSAGGARGKKVTVLGAGLSSTYLLEYLGDHAPQHGWTVRVGDGCQAVAQDKLKRTAGAQRNLTQTFELDGTSDAQIQQEVAGADLVISMLPVPFHARVMGACVAAKKPLLTASYASAELMRFDEQARRDGTLLMMECGVDPGIDHMVSMRQLHALRSADCAVRGFESFTGGLVAPESDNNPWHYKFSWNPRNVVLAGQGVSMFVQDGKLKYIPYNQLFRRHEAIHIPGWGDFEGLANRDSLKYRSIYGLENCPTLYRGTLRRPGYCDAWNVFVQLGMTDDTYVVEGSKDMTFREFVDLYLPETGANDSVELKLAYYISKPVDSPEMRRLRWLGIFENRKIGLGADASPARILQHLLEPRWRLGPDDLDMIVMFNRYVYEEPRRPGKRLELSSAMVVKGVDTVHTAMAKTVGLPVAMVAKLILTGKLSHLTGIQRPVLPEIYEPVLNELAENGVAFEDIATVEL